MNGKMLIKVTLNEATDPDLFAYLTRFDNARLRAGAFRALASAAARGDQLRINAGLQVRRGDGALAPAATPANVAHSGNVHSALAVEPHLPKMPPVATTNGDTTEGTSPSRISGYVSRERIDTDAIGDGFANF